MLTSLTLKLSGSTEKIDLRTEGITIFVGPNNSGKSMLLREVQKYLVNNNDSEKFRIISDLRFKNPSKEKFDEILTRISSIVQQEDMPADQMRVGNIDENGNINSHVIHPPSVFEYSKNDLNRHLFASMMLRHDCVRLDGRTRFRLVDDQTYGDLTGPASSHLVRLFQNDEAREKVRDLVHDAFGVYFVIDPTSGSKLRVRLSETEPGKNEQSLDKAARSFHAAARLLKDASDGVQAYIGILLTLFSGKSSIVLLDEPEAFLHPPLARKLGTQIGNNLISEDTALLAATHSSDFLVGCLQSKSKVRIVRLSFSDGRANARIIENDTLREFYQKPLMRSSNVISSLFYDGVVVTESDNDRSFYQEIFHRVSRKMGSKAPGVLFINAQNWQTMKEIVAPLRASGVPTAAVVDIDILNADGGKWNELLQAIQIPRAMSTMLGGLKGNVFAAFDGNKEGMKTGGGISILDKQAREAANNLFDLLDGYGLFVVRNGELESWLPSLDVNGKKDWVPRILEKMGWDEQSEKYIRPTSGDVWRFISSIMVWIRDPERKGLSWD